MVQVPINPLAIVAAAALQMIIGYIWYGPLFGKMWMSLSGVSQSGMEAGKKGMWKNYLLAFIGSLVAAFVLDHAIIFAGTYLEITGFSAGLQGGFWNWLGFVAPVTLGSVLWEGKSWKLWTLMNSYYLVSFLAMGLLLALWQ